MKGLFGSITGNHRNTTTTTIGGVGHNITAVQHHGFQRSWRQQHQHPATDTSMFTRLFLVAGFVQECFGAIRIGRHCVECKTGCFKHFLVVRIAACKAQSGNVALNGDGGGQVQIDVFAGNAPTTSESNIEHDCRPRHGKPVQGPNASAKTVCRILIQAQVGHVDRGILGDPDTPAVAGRVARNGTAGHGRPTDFTGATGATVPTGATGAAVAIQRGRFVRGVVTLEHAGRGRVRFNFPKRQRSVPREEASAMARHRPTVVQRARRHDHGGRQLQCATKLDMNGPATAPGITVGDFHSLKHHCPTITHQNRTSIAVVVPTTIQLHAGQGHGTTRIDGQDALFRTGSPKKPNARDGDTTHRATGTVALFVVKISRIGLQSIAGEADPRCDTAPPIAVPFRAVVFQGRDLVANQWNVG